MVESFQKISTKTIYKGRVIDVRVDKVAYKNKEINWEIVEMGDAVVIVPIIKPDTFVILHQYRYTAQKYIWEFPAGRAEDGEAFEVCAQRELEEECGYNARKFHHALSYYPSPGVITEIMHLYFAAGLYEKSDRLPDEDEIIDIKTVSAHEIEDMIKQGRIQDAKTILAYYHYTLNREAILENIF